MTVQSRTIQPTDSTKISLTDPLVVSWAVLVALTLTSLWLGAGHSVAGMSGRAATMIILVVAFAKAGLVAAHFMEVKSAAPPLRWIVGTLLSVAMVVTLALYLWA
ncbi:hypothetical protein BST36_23285 [Mycolicibacterium moriokaense]|uniref:Cytochrome c oxidase subunit IV n=1 Tax=Mycolicibacterium moriokaense TaxID=39691 RepID=A0AAD1H759_9MYCO|nr:cytochrome C oxidase subunit IV family protein [Mycolicibacterium moriokaense]MCV7039198.1 cytochrome C oxidase subunit IV family protein [Mycolicibacterium moriokaense]ORB18521.1 hypothetical protein BST36_23285 [Mycolicibacterium moriokaense]BBX00103.1 hypothetical protein MMOR_10390 [Mycolicibacterium moriokaense]